jgi:hypothetical protein
MKGQESKMGPIPGWVPGNGRVIRKGWKRVNVVETVCIMYENGKMRSVETNTSMGAGRIKEKGMNSTLIYCKNFCKCHNVSLCTTIIC